MLNRDAFLQKLKFTINQRINPEVATKNNTYIVNGYNPTPLIYNLVTFVEQKSSSLTKILAIKKPPKSISQILDEYSQTHSSFAGSLDWCMPQKFGRRYKDLHLLSTPNIFRNMQKHYEVSFKLAFTQELIDELILDIYANIDRVEFFSSHSTGAITHLLALVKIYKNDKKFFKNLTQIHFVNPNIQIQTVLENQLTLASLVNFMGTKIQVYYISKDPILSGARMHARMQNKRRKNYQNNRLNIPLGLGPISLRYLSPEIKSELLNIFEFVEVSDSTHATCPSYLYTQ